MKHNQKSSKRLIRTGLLILAASICCAICSCASSRVVHSHNGTAYEVFD